MSGTDSSSPAVRVVCAVLVDREGFFLAVERPAGRALAGLWEFPGGKVEAGESSESALRRELEEELALIPRDEDEFLPLTPVTHRYEFATICLLPYLVRCGKRPDLRLLEHADHRWILPEEAGTLSWAPADLPVLEELRGWLPSP
jgi:8-oxo-dGTP diphosphatase